MNATALRPAFRPLRVSDPAATNLVQRWDARFGLTFTARQLALPLVTTFRPTVGRENASFTVAGSDSVNRRLVPSGTVFVLALAAEMAVRPRATANVDGTAASFETIGAWLTMAAVNVWSGPTVVPSAFVARART